MGLLAVGGVMVAVTGKDAEQSTVRRTAAPVNRQQPPGPVPPGKVWSTEHGHWHDAAPATTSSPIQVESRPAGQSIPQPAGPVPAGKVWSPEHGHWHDVTPK